MVLVLAVIGLMNYIASFYGWRPGDASWHCVCHMCPGNVRKGVEEIHCGLVYHAASLHRNAMHGNVFGCIRGCDDRDQSFQACDSGRVTRYPAVNIKRCGKGIFFPGNNLQMFGLPHRFVCLRGATLLKSNVEPRKWGPECLLEIAYCCVLVVFRGVNLS